MIDSINPWPELENVFATFYNKNLDQKGKFPKTVRLKQIHSNRVVLVDQENPPEILGEGDALVSKFSNISLTIHTADCMPILAYGDNVIGACHVGWRGLKDGIIRNWILSLVSQGAQKQKLKISIGPHIGSCHFEVGEDVADQLISNLSPNELQEIRILRKDKNPCIDLGKLALWHLNQIGISKDQVFVSNECTYCNPELYYSYRRDGSGVGRLVSAIWMTRPSL